MARLTMLLGLVGLVAVPMVPAAHAQTPSAGASPNVIVVKDSGVGLLAVDPATGELRWQVEDHDGVSGAIAADGVVYISVASGDGSATDVYAVPVISKEPELIGHMQGRAVAAGVTPAGDRLQLLELPSPDLDGRIGPPTGVRSLSIPDRLPGDTVPVASRDDGWGMLSADGSMWYRLRPSQTDRDAPPELELSALLFDEGGSLTSAGLRLPNVSGYHSLLMAPDGSTLYIIDYYDQVIHVVDAAHLSVVRSINFGQERFKRPLCAVALSPEGSRLYVLGNAGNWGDGILVFETTSWRRVDHLVPGRDFYCLAVSPDGNSLYASYPTSWVYPFPPTDPLLATIDTRTGREELSVPLGLGDCCAWLVAAISTTDAGS
ncbi:MAG: hypothetical protein ACRDJH_21140 [Thermomicrobiales bacterium]